MLLQGYADFELVGQGGLGRVYRARRVSTGGMVAIKELLEISAGSPTWHRARRELDALLRLKGHPHVVNVEEVVDGPAGPCLVMEYAPGGSLFDRVQRGPLSAAELVLVGQHVCDALAASHAVGVIHRDIKPHNLLIGAFGQVKVCDFGIASLARDGEARTKTGSLTMAYASPEELDGSDDIGPPADAYSFAATMLHLASGRRPSFQDRVDAAAADFSINDDALAPTIAVLRQALAHNPADRPTLADLSASFDEAAIRLGSERIKVLKHVQPIHAPYQGVPQSEISAPPWQSQASDGSTRPRSVIEPPPAYDAVSATTIMRPPPPPVAPVVPQQPIRSATPSVSLLVGLVSVGALVIAAVLFASGRDSADSNDAAPAATASATTQAVVDSSAPSNSDEDTSEDTQPTVNTVTASNIQFEPSQEQCPGDIPLVEELPISTCTKGQAVGLMQFELDRRGYDLGPDGIDSRFGPDTEVALMNFQHDHALPVNGIANYETWKELFREADYVFGDDRDGDGVLVPGEIYYG